MCFVQRWVRSKFDHKKNWTKKGRKIFQSKNIYPKEVSEKRKKIVENVQKNQTSRLTVSNPPPRRLKSHKLNLNDGRDKAVMCLSQEVRSYPLDHWGFV